MRKLIFSLSRNDFEWQFFRAGGKGGQKQNKTSSACRCVHRESGAVGEAREERSQAQNRKAAFRRCAQSKLFESWVKLRASRYEANVKEIEVCVNQAMSEENLKIEYF